MKNKFLICCIVGVQLAIAHEEHLLTISIDCEKKDSIKVTISNYGNESVCYHVPEEVHSYYENKYVFFFPRYSKYIEHMEGRPFSIDCLRPFKDSYLEQEYKKDYVIANVFDKNVKNIQGFFFSTGSIKDFRFLKNFGTKDYQKQVLFLKNHTNNLPYQCVVDKKVEGL